MHVLHGGPVEWSDEKAVEGTQNCRITDGGVGGITGALTSMLEKTPNSKNG